MKVLLWTDVDKLGNAGQTVEVKPGFARNYLFPRTLASLDTPAMRRGLEQAKKKHAKIEAKQLSDAKGVAQTLEKISVSIEVNTTEEGKLYGSVTPTMISDAVREQGITLEPKVIEIPDAIKQVGYYEVIVQLHKELKPKLKVWVVSTNVTPAAPAQGSPSPGSDASPASSS